MEHGFVAWFLDPCHENMRVVKQAPEAFLIMGLLVSVVVYLAVSKFHEERFADLGERIAFLDDRVSDYQTRLKGASPEEAAKEITKLNNQLSAAETKINALQKTLSLRSFPPRQLAEIGAAVSDFKDIALDIFIVGDSADLQPLAAQLSAQLQQAHWLPLTWVWSGIGPFVGAVITIKDGISSSNLAAARALSVALQGTDVPASIEPWPGKWEIVGGMLNGPPFSADRAQIRLVVGLKKAQ